MGIDKETVKSTLETIDEVDKFVGKKFDRFEKKHGKKATILLMVSIVFLLVISGVLWRSTISSGVKSAIRNYSYAKEEKRAEAKEYAYNKAYEFAIKNNQATNEVYISTQEIKETANLQVLAVLEREVVTQTEEEKNDITYWILYEGKGIYTVNLQISEFIIDQERHYVLARIPKPELEIYYGKEEIKLNTKKGLGDGSDKKGSDMLRGARERAQQTIREKIETNKEYSVKAEAEAKTQIEKLIKLFNSSVEDLKVDVKFYGEE